MVPVSVVIITRNEAERIRTCIQAARLISDDIVLIDNGSTDLTREIAASYSCRVFSENWSGYGSNKNKGIRLAKYDWIFSIDADEIPDSELVKTIHDLKFDDPNQVFDIHFQSYFGLKRIRFGKWGRDHHIRLFNRTQVKWSESIVHEKLELHKHISVSNLNGYIHHYSARDLQDFKVKNLHYAKLSAVKYSQTGKRSSFTKLYFSPAFNFVRNYIFCLGFLDGREGWEIAKITFFNTWYKYHCLKNIAYFLKNDPFLKENLLVEY